MNNGFASCGTASQTVTSTPAPEMTDRERGRFVQKHDLTGKRFFRFVAQKSAGRGNWLCLCDCGNTRVKAASHLMAGRAHSCGCLRSDLKAQRDARFGRNSTELRPITQEALKAVLNYDPMTGVFTWLEATARRIKIGSVAGRPNGFGYWALHIAGRNYPAHHVAWFYMHGRWPAHCIDHINLQRNDNRIANLREATPAQNGHNTKVPRNNTSGFKGVSRQGGRWVAEIMVNQSSRRLGSFLTREAASEAYLMAKRQLHSHYVEGQGVRV